MCHVQTTTTDWKHKWATRQPLVRLAAGLLLDFPICQRLVGGRRSAAGPGAFNGFTGSFLLEEGFLSVVEYEAK